MGFSVEKYSNKQQLIRWNAIKLYKLKGVFRAGVVFIELKADQFNHFSNLQWISQLSTHYSLKQIFFHCVQNVCPKYDCLWEIFVLLKETSLIRVCDAHKQFVSFRLRLIHIFAVTVPNFNSLWFRIRQYIDFLFIIRICIKSPQAKMCSLNAMSSFFLFVFYEIIVKSKKIGFNWWFNSSRVACNEKKSDLQSKLVACN